MVGSGGVGVDGSESGMSMRGFVRRGEDELMYSGGDSVNVQDCKLLEQE